MSKRRINNRIRKKGKKDKTAAVLIGFVVMLLFCLVGYNTISLKNKVNEGSEKEEILEKQIGEAEKTSEELETKEQYMQTKKYVEDVAKDKIGLVYPDEIIIKPEE